MDQVCLVKHHLQVHQQHWLIPALCPHCQWDMEVEAWVGSLFSKGHSAWTRPLQTLGYCLLPIRLWAPKKHSFQLSQWWSLHGYCTEQGYTGRLFRPPSASLSAARRQGHISIPRFPLNGWCLYWQRCSAGTCLLPPWLEHVFTQDNSYEMLLGLGRL